MKKNLSLAGFSLVAMGLFMGSCVSKRKYMDAQASAAQRYSTDSAQWASRTNTMQQNISALEQRSSDYQKQMDSFRTTSSNYQKRWDNFQSAYTQQNTSTEQLHQQIHTAIDQYVEASNVESKNGKIYVNLPEKMLFTSGSSTLSAKGKQALDKLADVLASNQNVDVDIIASAAYYNSGTATTSGTGTDNANMNANDASNSSAGTTGRNNNTTTSGKSKDAAKSESESTAKSNSNAQSADTSDNPTASSNAARNNQSANLGDSAYPGSGSRTAKSAKQDPNKKQSTAKSRTAKTSTAKTNKANQGDRSVSFSSTPKSSSKTKSTASAAPSWNLNVARSTAIVRQLTQNGLPQARILLTGQNGKGITTNEWASSNRGYQIVVSPKMDSYYQMMQEGQQGQGSTSMK